MIDVPHAARRVQRAGRGGVLFLAKKRTPPRPALLHLSPERGIPSQKKCFTLAEGAHIAEAGSSLFGGAGYGEKALRLNNETKSMELFSLMSVYVV